MRQSSSVGQLKKARRRRGLLVQIPARGRGSEAEARANSKPIPCILCSTLHSADEDSTIRRLEDTKRQRTGSGSSSSPPNGKISPQDVNSEDEGDAGTKSGEGGNKKIRGAAARNHRNKELREREEQRERERADAAGRRKGRAERRRGDGIAPSVHSHNLG